MAAASDWDAPVELKMVLASRLDSIERVLHDSGLARFVLPLRHASLPLRQALAPERLQRAIGVIYRPETERWSHYSHAILPKQFDAYVWFDETEAVTPLPGEQRPGEEETYPFGL